MKGFLVFLTVALLATANASPVETVDERGVIDDVLNTIKCLKETVAGIQSSIGNIAGTVSNLNNIINSNIEKMNDCLAIGGSNPSISDQIASAQCIAALGSSIKAELSGLVKQIAADIANLMAAAENIGSCF